MRDRFRPLHSPRGTRLGHFPGLCAQDPGFLLLQLVFPAGTPPFHFIAGGESGAFGPFRLHPLTFDTVSFDLTGGQAGSVTPVTRVTIR
jgi:hypothetical protein